MPHCSRIPEASRRPWELCDALLHGRKNEPQTSSALSVSNVVINGRKDALFPPQPEDRHISVGN